MNSDNIEDAFTLCDRRRRILKEDGHMLVVGGPGSGKTTIALLKARRRILEQRLNAGQKVLFLSFSNAAIRRIMESAGEILTSDISKQVDIKNYHSFTLDVLMSHGYLTSSKRRIEVVPAQDAIVLKAGLSENEWQTKQERLYADEGLVTFDQFAPRATELLRRSTVIRTCFCAAYPLILVDEFQDTDEDQWALIQVLSEQSEIVGLGDANQQIFDWRHGASETRLKEFTKILECERFDFVDENNRSPAKGIASFARSLLSPGFEQSFPDEIFHQRFKPWQFEMCLHFAVRKTLKATKKLPGNDQPKIVIAARSKRLVRIISDILASNITVRGRELKSIQHDVLIDRNQILFASRVIANVISNTDLDCNDRLAESLDRIADIFLSTDRPNIKKSDTLRKWANRCRSGDTPTTKCVTALTNVIEQIKKDNLTGRPVHDWIAVRKLFEKTDIAELKKVANDARYLRLLRRGSVIEQALIALWVAQDNYKGAEAALKQATLQDQLLDTQRETATVSVMNMHQLKGREYDAVILVENQHHAFMAKDESTSYINTRRLLHMSLTRAREFILIVSNTGKDTFDRLISKDISKHP